MYSGWHRLGQNRRMVKTCNIWQLFSMLCFLSDIAWFQHASALGLGTVPGSGFLPEETVRLFRGGAHSSAWPLTGEESKHFFKTRKCSGNSEDRVWGLAGQSHQLEVAPGMCPPGCTQLHKDLGRKALRFLSLGGCSMGTSCLRPS